MPSDDAQKHDIAKIGLTPPSSSAVIFLQNTTNPIHVLEVSKKAQVAKVSQGAVLTHVIKEAKVVKVA